MRREQVIDLLQALHILLDCGGTADGRMRSNRYNAAAGRAREGRLSWSSTEKGARYE